MSHRSRELKAFDRLYLTKEVKLETEKKEEAKSLAYVGMPVRKNSKASLGGVVTSVRQDDCQVRFVVVYEDEGEEVVTLSVLQQMRLAERSATASSACSTPKHRDSSVPDLTVLSPLILLTSKPKAKKDHLPTSPSSSPPGSSSSKLHKNQVPSNVLALKSRALRIIQPRHPRFSLPQVV